jgi:Uma2 family endonuclease
MATIIQMQSREARYRGLRMTADAYLALEDDGYRYELVDGVICMSPSPPRLHQRIVTEIVRQVGNHLLQKPIGEVIVEVDVRLTDDLVYRPDVIFLSADQAAACRDRITVVPDVIVEVVSPDSRRYDHETTKQDYESCGVREYWLIDPDKHELVFYRLEGGRFVEAAAAQHIFASKIISEFELDLGRLRDLFATT